MNDPRCRRHHTEIREGALSPLEELVALLISLKLTVAVDFQGEWGVECVDLHRMVDYEVRLHLRIDQLGGRLIPRHPNQRRPHGGQVDQCRNSGEILEHHASRPEGDLGVADLGGVIAGECQDILIGDGVTVVVAQNRFQEHLHRVWQGVDVGSARQGVDAKDFPLPQRSLNLLAGTEWVVRHGWILRSLTGDSVWSRTTPEPISSLM